MEYYIVINYDQCMLKKNQDNVNITAQFNVFIYNKTGLLSLLGLFDLEIKNARESVWRQYELKDRKKKF